MMVEHRAYPWLTPNSQKDRRRKKDNKSKTKKKIEHLYRIYDGETPGEREPKNIGADDDQDETKTTTTTVPETPECGAEVDKSGRYLNKSSKW